MGIFSWGNARLVKEEYPVHVSGVSLTLHRYYANSDTAHKSTPVFMVHGFNESPSVFAPDEADAGLACYLADAGFDVFVAELRCSTSVNLPGGLNASLDLHQLILEDLPAHLAAVAKIRPREPQFWVGHGLGNVLLLSCMARLDLLPAQVLGMVQFAASRRCELGSLGKAIRYMVWQSAISIGACKQEHSKGLPGSGCGRRLLSDLEQWQKQPLWRDLTDDFDYRQALASRYLPPCLYFSAAKDRLLGGIDDTRLWVSELGRHDAQLLLLGRGNGNSRNYDYTSMLTHRDACSDHFVHMLHWLNNKKTQAVEEIRCLA
ncbi:hypothetical protein [Candidatus Pelagadaptatus aseana]|uniref:hypothetical protein n=1 Tax=Candidatus Pelagadaptatus aseana TaxID=3120508 RepID=UPI003C6FB63C